MRLAHQEEIAFRTVCKMAKFEDVYLDKSWFVSNELKNTMFTMMDDDVYKLLMLIKAKEEEHVEHDENDKEENNIFGNTLVPVEDQEDVVNEEEVKDAIYNYDDAVCDSIVKGFGSSYNSHDAMKQDEVAALQEGEVDEEPGGNVSTRSRSPRFRPFNA